MADGMHDDIEDRLRSLLAESIDDARQRERTELDRRIGAYADRVLLFGAGNLGRRTLANLRRHGLEPLGFIDNNPSLWGCKINGLEVYRPVEAAKKFEPSQVAVITTIWCGEATDKMADRIGPLRALGYRNIALFGHLAWAYPETFLPHYSLDLPSRALGEGERILKALDLFRDRRSREIYLAHVEWRLHLDYDKLPLPVGDTIYFNKRLVRPVATEVLIDGGAFIGDTIASFLETFGRTGFHSVQSFEPDPANYVKLEKYVAGLPTDIRSRISTHASALGERAGAIHVETSGNPSSRVGHGDYEVRCRTIDEVADETSDPTFIKLDLEGYEPPALQGATRTLKRASPVVAVCVYHLQNHLWEIPLQLDHCRSDYQYYLTPHLADGWDLVLYAIPHERLARHA